VWQASKASISQQNTRKSGLTWGQVWRHHLWHKVTEWRVRRARTLGSFRVGSTFICNMHIEHFNYTLNVQRLLHTFTSYAYCLFYDTLGIFMIHNEYLYDTLSIFMIKCQMVQWQQMVQCQVCLIRVLLKKPSPLYNGYWVFPGGKAAGAWHWPPTPNQGQG
jgi:hypothetical protein